MTSLLTDWTERRERLRRSDLVRSLGKVTRVLGLAVEAAGATASVGDLCEIRSPRGRVLAEVVGFRDDRLVLMPLGDVAGIGPGSEVLATARPPAIAVGPELLGRVIDGLGRPIDAHGPLGATIARPIHQQAPPPALSRQRISEPLETGVRAVDALLPIGRGQRVGIFSGSGVGKSTLLGSFAGHAAADVNVIALIGERGREVREFVERDLGPAGLARSVVVVATADEPPLVRRQAAFVAAAVADYFRDAGRTVLFMMDSLTRLAMGQREIGLAAGEPPATRGYPPSVFALLPQILERAGTTSHRGSITGLYTVLVEGDDLNDPVADTSRAILDGHIVLTRELAAANHFPAIDVLASVSRLTGDLLTPEEYRAAAALREHLATYRAAHDLIAIGAYVGGSDARIDAALAALDAVNDFLRQAPHVRCPRRESLDRLQALFPISQPTPTSRPGRALPAAAATRG
jgi:flagellum-specific ATP synthase